MDISASLATGVTLKITFRVTMPNVLGSELILKNSHKRSNLITLGSPPFSDQLLVVASSACTALVLGYIAWRRMQRSLIIKHSIVQWLPRSFTLLSKFKVSV